MNLASRLIQRFLALDPPLTRDLVVEHDLPVRPPACCRPTRRSTTTPPARRP
jgi:hypothetical protein